MLTGTLSAIAQEVKQIDLSSLFNRKELVVHNRVAQLQKDDTKNCIVLNEDVEEGLAVIPGIKFSTGVLEIDLKGQNVFQHSFIGLAFHMVDSDKFDAIYFRPFQFLSSDPVLKARSVQYISLPEHTWQKLREEGPGKFENTITPIPDPDSWFHAKIVVKENEVQVFVNNETSASITVPILNKHKTGSIALYVADRSGGTFANLTVRAM